jgi:CheY-like chemotaxis protein
LAIIGRSGEHLLALINDVLELSKIEAGRSELHEESFDLHRMLAGLEEMFRLRTAEKGLSLSFQRTEGTPPHVRLDQSKLRQILINLLGNAVKFTECGTVILRVGVGADPGTLHFEVQDTGVGIGPDEVGGLFDAFVQTASGQQAHEGTGLGLPISRQFVRLMGGDILANSTPGEGTLFEFDVRFELADGAEAQGARPRRRVVGLEPGQSASDGGPYRLLVVEDHEVGRRLLVELLRPLGFEVGEATNGREALRVWQQWAPHLIWMDIKMPVMDGLEATRRIRVLQRDEATQCVAAARDTVIVALTASALQHEEADILAAGCDGLVRKPFREDEVLEALGLHLGVRYLYEGSSEDSEGPGATEVNRGEGLTPARLAALPTELVTSLLQATVQGRYADMLAAAEHIEERDAPLGSELQALIQGFEYDRLLAYIEQAGAAPGVEPGTETL